MSHDYNAQKAETFETFEALGEGADLPARAVVTYQFFPESSEPNWAGLTKALEAKGFRCEVFEDEDTLDASIGPMAVTPDAIWTQEKIATEIALKFEFEPDGWVLMEDEA
jgi:hypothetical protein